MSADNYTTCPHCLAAANAELKAKRQTLLDRYGQMDAIDFVGEMNALPETVDERDYQTLREDYEFYGADSGTVKYSYKCFCPICSLMFDFAGEHKFWPAT